MKRMLFNATHAEETRVGIVDGQKLIDIDIETAGREARKSNIYKGIVTRIEPSLEACFVNYGEERHGFLPFKEISRAYFKEGVDVRTATIREAITEGQELIVQVEKEERGNKGAALTTFVSLAGRYLVLMPNNPRAGGVSRRIEGEERQELREAMEKLELPRGMSTIARTAGIGRTTEELQWDLNYLLKLWEAISDAALPQYELVVEENGRRRTTATTEAVVNGKALKRLNPAPFLIVEESNLVVRAIRDYFQPDIGEILVDTDDIYEQARQFMEHVMPDMVGRVKRYREDIPLFTRFQIEQQIETAYSRTVPLPSGGAIVIDHTEALVAIDVNSARATRGADIEETAFRTNCEAADEVARQMRLRDLGGLIVIDFIDMADAKNQRAVEQRLKEAIHCDRARVQMAKISRFGLMELSRQRLRPSLSEGSHITCPRCNGVGVIRDTESCALQVLRILQEEAMKEGTGAVHAQIPVDVATFLLNEKRNDIMKLEARHRVPIVLIPNTFLETPHYHIERLRQDDERLESTVPSFSRVEEIETKADDPYAKKSQDEKPARPKQVPVIKNVLPREPAPVHVEAPREERRAEKKTAGRPAQMTPVPEKKGLFARIAAFLFGSSEEKKTEEKVVEVTPKAEDKTAKAEGERRGRRSSRRGGERSRGRRTERTDRLERAEKGEKLEKAEKLEKQVAEGVKNVEKADKVEKAEKAEKSERPRRGRRRSSTATAEAAVPAAEEAVKLEAPEAAEKVEPVEAANVEAPKVAAPEVAEAAEGERSRGRRRRGRRRPAAEGEAADAQKAEGVEAEVRDVKDAPDAPKGEVAEVVEPAEVAEAAEATHAVEAAEAPEAAEAAEAAEGETEGRSRRRRSRRRRSRGAAEDAAKTETGEKAEEAAAVAEAAESAEAPQALEAVPAPVVPEAPQAPVAPIVAPEPELVQIETKKSPVTLAVESAIREEAAEAARAEAHAAAAPAPVVEAPAAVEVPAEAIEKVEAVEAVEVVEAAPAAETVEALEPVKAEPARTGDVAEGLAENLAAAGLVQVETRADRPVFTGYEVVVQPGRVVAKASADADEGRLEQVHTRPELCRPVVYEAVRYPGRPYTAIAVTEEGPLEQVHTKPLA